MSCVEETGLSQPQVHQQEELGLDEAVGDPKLSPEELDRYAQDILDDARRVVDYDAYKANRQEGQGPWVMKKMLLPPTASGQQFDVVIRYFESDELDADGKPTRREAQVYQGYDTNKPKPTEPFTIRAEIKWSKKGRFVNKALADAKAAGMRLIHGTQPVKEATVIRAQWYNPNNAYNDPLHATEYFGEGMSQKWNTKRAVFASKALLSQLLHRNTTSTAIEAPVKVLPNAGK